MLTLDDFRPIAVSYLVRLGRANDGGYVVSRKSIAEAELMLSFEVNDDVSFETDSKKLNPRMKIFCFDHSVSLAVLSKRTAKLLLKGLVLASQFDFEGARRELRFPERLFSFIRFFRMDDCHFIQKMLWYEANDTCVDIDSLLSDTTGAGSLGGDDRVFIKMDIEGSEYRFLERIIPYSDRVTGIAVEFHDVDIHREKVAHLLGELKKMFQLVHAHGNNISGYAYGTDMPMTMELSFINKALLCEDLSRPALDYPVAGLDQPNYDRRPDLPLKWAKHQAGCGMNQPSNLRGAG